MMILSIAICICFSILSLFIFQFLVLLYSSELFNPFSCNRNLYVFLSNEQ